MAATTAPPPAAPPDATEPGPGSEPPRVGWPPALRRALIAVVLVACVAALVWANSRAEVGPEATKASALVLAQSPPPGGEAPQQSTVGVELRPGYDGRLTINGIAIPEEQMDGAVDPRTLTPAQLEKFGVRTNNRNSVFFTPGPGKVIESFDTGPLYVSVRYFRDRQPAKTLNTISWSFKID